MQYLRFSQAVCLFFFGLGLLTTTTVFGQASSSAAKTVSLTVIVTDDDGRTVSGLAREQFSVFEKTTQLDIAEFDSFDKPASVAFLFDLSESVPVPFKNAAGQAAYQFIQKSNQANDYLIVGFDKETMLLGDWGMDQQGVKKALDEVVHYTPKRNTALYDACSMTLKRLESSKYSTHVLLLFSDGQDNMSKLSFKRLREELKESSATLYTIGLVNQVDVGSSLGMEGQGVLGELASVSGGKAYYPPTSRNTRELQDVLDQISLELSHHYTIRFSSPSATPDNKWHAIKVKLTLPPKDKQGHKYPHLNVRSRGGYYAR